ncbi:MAG TPA: STAS domain-containing protein [Verrucomicrobiae bacterium]|nr:STAS domain-containing protein [Verrucomicrobiae bacterium]
MSTSSATLMVLACGHFACVQIHGRANFASALDFKSLCNGLREEHFDRYLIDLTDCTLMDSTFLGVLSGFGLRQPGVELLNPNPRITELLDNLGVLHLFQVTHGPLKLPSPPTSSAPTPLNPSKIELKEASLEAHQTLMSICSDNVPKFKELTQFLAEDLKRLKSGA